MTQITHTTQFTHTPFGTVHTLFTSYDTVHKHFDIDHTRFDTVHTLFTSYDKVHTHFDKVHTLFGTVFTLSQAMTQITNTLT